LLSRSASAPLAKFGQPESKSKRRSSFFSMVGFGTRNKRGLSTSSVELTSIIERQHERHDSGESTSTAASAPSSPVKKPPPKKLARSASVSSQRPRMTESAPGSSTFPQIPAFPCKRMQLSSFQECVFPFNLGKPLADLILPRRCEFLMKYQALHFGLGMRHGSFRPRLIALCKWPTSAGFGFSLHVFKSNQPDDVRTSQPQ
jgi:hypothetical protein